MQRIEMGGNLSKLIRSADSGAPVAQVRDGQKHWFVQDHIGSTIALAAADGSIGRLYDYDVDGNATTTGTAPETWIKYAGGHDIGGGLYHYGARFYQPSTARWTQMDPLQQPGDLRQHGRYGYVGGDPINATDPDGLCIRLRNPFRGGPFSNNYCGRTARAASSRLDSSLRRVSRAAPPVSRCLPLRSSGLPHPAG